MAIGIAVLVIGCGAIAAGWGYVRAARKMRSFASTLGTVLDRELSMIPGGNGEGRWGRGGSYQPKVTYSYVVGGVEHTSNRWSYAIPGLKRTLAQAQLAAVPDDVEVFYDPAAPQEAYLQKNTPVIGYVLLAGGALGTLGALAVLFR